MKLRGYIDLQVNGYLGVDFSASDLTHERCAYACRKLLDCEGVGGFLPTVITSHESVYRQNLAILADIIESDEFSGSVLGIHAEGPFISDRPGAVGAHNLGFVKKPDISFFDQMQDWARGHIKVMTIAAEVAGAQQLCKYAVANGVVVSLGHQLADASDLKELAQAGATLMTHVGNGMPNMVHRHNNSLVTALSIKELTAMIITDGHHLPAHVIEAVINAKGVDKVIITSDASPIAGMKPGKYDVLGNSAVLEENGLLHNPEKECLVGSSANIVQCVEYLRSLGIVSESEITQMAALNPAKVLE
ncbi:MAG: N-acetylglucosamine-6-phosphate deacetylase [Sedimentisphaeraceae bacterium JB056]